jgi:hypothetical protein
MKRHGNWIGLITVLALGVFLLAGNKATSADDDAKVRKAAQKDLLDLAKAIESGKVNPKAAAAIHKKYEDLNDLMVGFKPRDKGGIGVGPKGPGDGIELKLNTLGKRALSKMQLGKERAELTKMAYIMLAYAEVAPHYAPTRPKGGKGAKEWKQYNDDWRKGTRELLDALKMDSPDKLKKAANNINNACNSCHSDFRDS